MIRPISTGARQGGVALCAASAAALLLSGLILSGLMFGCAAGTHSGGGGASGGVDSELEEGVRAIIAVGITKTQFEAFNPTLLEASDIGNGYWGEYPTASAVDCRIAAMLMATRMMAETPSREGACIARCGDALMATAVVRRQEVELSHGAPGEKNDLRLAPRQ